MQIPWPEVNCCHQIYTVIYLTILTNNRCLLFHRDSFWISLVCACVHVRVRMRMSIPTSKTQRHGSISQQFAFHSVTIKANKSKHLFCAYSNAYRIASVLCIRLLNRCRRNQWKPNGLQFTITNKDNLDLISCATNEMAVILRCECWMGPIVGVDAAQNTIYI